LLVIIVLIESIGYFIIKYAPLHYYYLLKIIIAIHCEHFRYNVENNFSMMMILELPSPLLGVVKAD